jgi:hypothetical protein
MNDTTTTDVPLPICTSCWNELPHPHECIGSHCTTCYPAGKGGFVLFERDKCQACHRSLSSPPRLSPNALKRWQDTGATALRWSIEGDPAPPPCCKTRWLVMSGELAGLVVVVLSAGYHVHTHGGAVLARIEGIDPNTHQSVVVFKLGEFWRTCDRIPAFTRSAGGAISFVGLGGILTRLLTPRVAHMLVEDFMVEHVTGREYHRIRAVSGPRQAGENDKWLGREGDAFRARVRDELCERKRCAFREMLIASGSSTTYEAAAREREAFPLNVAA